jgi:Flp pilus assembly protein TadB
MIYEDIADEFRYLASLEKVGMADIHNAVTHLSEKYGCEEYFKQVFYAIISIQLNNDER